MKDKTVQLARKTSLATAGECLRKYESPYGALPLPPSKDTSHSFLRSLPLPVMPFPLLLETTTYK